MNATEVFKMVQKAFGDQSLSRKTVYQWHKLFKEGHVSVEDEPCSGRPSTSITEENIEKIRNRVMENHHMIVRELAEDVGISIGSADAILSDVLGLKHLSAKFVLKLLRNLLNYS